MRCLSSASKDQWIGEGVRKSSGRVLTISPGLRTRIHELEEEVRKLKVEHEKQVHRYHSTQVRRLIRPALQKGQIAKYKDRVNVPPLAVHGKALTGDDDGW